MLRHSAGMSGTAEPEVLGPVDGPRPPWGFPNADPGLFGYTVEEYHLRGVAACYEVVSDDPDAEVEVEESARRRTEPACWCCGR